jgi:hypothetical protein
VARALSGEAANAVCASESERKPQCEQRENIAKNKAQNKAQDSAQSRALTQAQTKRTSMPEIKRRWVVWFESCVLVPA